MSNKVSILKQETGIASVEVGFLQEVEKGLRLYFDFKNSLQIGKEIYLPRITAKLGEDEISPNHQIPELRKIVSFLEWMGFEGDQESFVRKYHEFLLKTSPEKMQYNSSTERCAVYRVDPDFENMLKDREANVMAIDNAMISLTKVQQMIN